MKKILVTTDLSMNSQAALRFAIQLASQNNYSLSFFYSCDILKPTLWSDSSFATYEKNEIEKIKQELYQFVSLAYENAGIIPEAIDCEVENGAKTDENIMAFAVKNKYDYICISRRGKGNSFKVFGTIISHLINKSEVPVIAVPNNYEPNQITSITYASDLENVNAELEKVNDFAASLDANVEVLHFKVPGDELIHTNLPLAIHFEPYHYEKSLIANLNKVIEQTRPSILVMFTKQKRTLLEKLFVSSISAEYAAVIKIPLLVFKKL
jgi:nucleotide-binding universal stress UspA family protein